MYMCVRCEITPVSTDGRWWRKFLNLLLKLIVIHHGKLAYLLSCRDLELNINS